MQFDLRKPCPKCPFRYDVTPFIHAERAEEIVDGITSGQQTFACHKFTEFDEDEEGEECNIPHAGDQHCAGALIMLEKMDRPNQMMRIAERLGFYDRSKLHMRAPVYEDGEAMTDAHWAAEA